MKLTGKIANDGIRAVSGNYYVVGHHKVPRIWILVADRHLARIFRKIDGHLELIGEAEPYETNCTESACNKTMGRVRSDASSSTHHEPETHMAPGEKKALSFAHGIAVWFDEIVTEDVFDRLVLFAAPKMSGKLRTALSSQVQNRIVAEASKDLTKMEENELLEELEKIIWF